MEYIKLNSEKTIIEQLNALNMKTLSAALDEMLENPVDVQNTLLKHILSHASDSAFGQKYGFSGIKGYDEYKNHVPVTEYDDYLPYIEDICKNGDKEQMYDSDTDAVISTSGTSGKFKLFAESYFGAMAKKQVMRARAVTILKLLGKEAYSGGKTLTVSNYAVRGKTESNIPIMAASGHTMRQISDNSDLKKIRKKWNAENVLPYDLVCADNLSPEESDYLSALFFLKADDVIAISSNNLDHAGIILSFIEKNHERLIYDLACCDISVPVQDDLKLRLIKNLKDIKPGRAEELKAIFAEGKGLQIEKVWKRLILVYCWLSGSTGYIAKAVSKRFPEHIKFLDCGYGASEGKFNVPIHAGHKEAPLAVFSVFFEFLPVGGKVPVTIDAVEDGQYYELVITTFSGLYRYNIHDIVKICGYTAKTPNIEFAGKSDEYIKCGENIVYLKEIIDSVNKTEEESGCPVLFFRCYKTGNEKISFLVQMDKKDFSHSFKEVLARNLNDMTGLTLEGISLMKDGYRESLYIRRTGGISVNAAKLAVILKEVPEVTNMTEAVL